MKSSVSKKNTTFVFFETCAEAGVANAATAMATAITEKIRTMGIPFFSISFVP
jgi:hypothetical protein